MYPQRTFICVAQLLGVQSCSSNRCKTSWHQPVNTQYGTHTNKIYVQVIPMLAGDATEQTPPDLPSYLFKERIVYLVRCLLLHKAECLQLWGAFRTIYTSLERLQGMSLVPAVTELVMAELLYLQYDAPTKPINLYINSTGVTVRIIYSLLLLCVA
jgi:ATP-dependent Clp protease, protease subunit